MSWFAWALLSAFFAGLTALLGKIGVLSVNANLATAIRTAVILLITWGIALTTSSRADWVALTPRTLFFLAASGVATGFSWLCYFRALRLGEVSKVAPVDKLSVVFAVLLAAIFLGERLSLREWGGVVLIVAGVILMVTK